MEVFLTAPFDPMSELQAAFTKVFQKPNWLVSFRSACNRPILRPAADGACQFCELTKRKREAKASRFSLGAVDFMSTVGM
jgi:hypothetical protein